MIHSSSSTRERERGYCQSFDVLESGHLLSFTPCWFKTARRRIIVYGLALTIRPAFRYGPSTYLSGRCIGLPANLIGLSTNLSPCNSHIGPISFIISNSSTGTLSYTHHMYPSFFYVSTNFGFTPESGLQDLQRPIQLFSEIPVHGLHRSVFFQSVASQFST